MRCEEVRELLPGHVDGDLHPAGKIDAHLATCSACSSELATYRELIESLGAIRDRTEDPEPAFLGRTLALIPQAPITIGESARARGRPLFYALASLGGAAVGATAIALVWWRRRSAPMSRAG